MPEKRQYHAEEPSDPDVVDWLQRAETHFGRFTFDIAGVILFAFGVMTLLALFNLTNEGDLLNMWKLTLRRWVGFGAYFVVIASGLSGLMLLRKRTHPEERVRWGRAIALEMAAFFALALFAVFGPLIFGGIPIERAEAGYDGGYIGWGLAELLGMVTTNFFGLPFGIFGRDLILVLSADFPHHWA
jgi:hypothetical protein